LAKRQNQMGIVSGKGQYYDAKAAPVGSLPPRTSGDAPWVSDRGNLSDRVLKKAWALNTNLTPVSFGWCLQSQGEASYQKSVGCPLGLKNKAKGQ
jgi:hypothetical protein